VFEVRSAIQDSSLDFATAISAQGEAKKTCAATLSDDLDMLHHQYLKPIAKEVGEKVWH